MKLIRYKKNNSLKHGLLKDDYVVEIEGDIFANYKLTNIKSGINEIKVFPPINPGKIIALGYNYKDLVGERLSYDG